MGAALRRDRYTRYEGSARGDGSIHDRPSQVEDPGKQWFRHRLNRKSQYNHRSPASMCNDVGTNSATITPQQLQHPSVPIPARTHNDGAGTYDSSYSPIRTVFSNATPQLQPPSPVAWRRASNDVNSFPSNTPHRTYFSNSTPQQLQLSPPARPNMRNNVDSYPPIRASALNQHVRRDELPYQEKSNYRESGRPTLPSDDPDDMGQWQCNQFEEGPYGEHLRRGRQRCSDYASNVQFGAAAEVPARADTRNMGQLDRLSYGHGGAYRSSDPTPWLLQNAADSVKQALAGCGNHIFRFIRSQAQLQQPQPRLTDTAVDGLVRLSNFRLPSIDPKRYLISSPYEASQWKPHREMTVCKFALRAFLSSVFFSEINWGFRTPEFFRPDELKRGLFEIYTRYESGDMLQKSLINELEKMSSNRDTRTGNPVGDDEPGAHLDTTSDSMDVLKLSIQDLRRFFLSKMESKQLSELTYDGELISMWPHSLQEKEALARPLYSDESFKKSVVRLATSVWLLQKLAFSFESTADIFHVPQGSQFDEEYMADDNDYDAPGGIQSSGDEYDDKSDDEYESDRRDLSRRNVALMLVPGFVVGSSIIKSRVICRREKMEKQVRHPSIDMSHGKWEKMDKQVRHPSIDMSDGEASHASIQLLSYSP